MGAGQIIFTQSIPHMILVVALIIEETSLELPIVILSAQIALYEVISAKVHSVPVDSLRR